MINKIDFVPRVAKPAVAGFLSVQPAQLEPMSSLLGFVNEWIATNRADVVNVETLLLVEDPDAGTQTVTAHITPTASLGAHPQWRQVQVVRVWYRTPSPPS
jgi:hypothetical protein